MDEKIIATYCLCDDLLHAMHHQEDPQCQMSDAEVLTTAFTAAFFFRGNLESARWMLKQHAYILQMLSKSRFSRRLHRLKMSLILLFDLLGHVHRQVLKQPRPTRLRPHFPRGVRDPTGSVLYASPAWDVRAGHDMPDM